MFYFPFSNLCPHCDQELISTSDFLGNEVIRISCSYDKTKNGWFKTNIEMIFTNHKLSAIAYRINNILIIVDSNKTYIYQLDEFGIGDEICRITDNIFNRYHFSELENNIDKILLLI